MEYKKVPTSPEVYAVIFARHRDSLKPFSIYSAGDCNQLGNPDEGVMSTEWGIDGCDIPIIGIETKWDIQGPKRYERHNEVSKHWLCIGIEDYD